MPGRGCHPTPFGPIGKGGRDRRRDDRDRYDYDRRDRDYDRRRDDYDRRRDDYRDRRDDRGRGAGAYGSARAATCSLFVGNLSYSCKAEDLEDLFRECGKLRSVSIGMNKQTGASKGFAFVEYEDVRDAEEAMRKFNGYTFENRRLRLDFDIGLGAKNLGPGKRGGGGGDRERERERSPRRDRSRSRDRGSPRGSKDEGTKEGEESRKRESSRSPSPSAKRAREEGSS
eukprot:tig00021433_g21269.t1